MKSIDSLIKIAEIHAKRLRFAMKHLSHKIPISEDDVKKIK